MTNDWTQLTFAHPWFFGLLLLVPLVAWWRHRHRSQRYPNLRMSSLQSVADTSSWRVRVLGTLPVLRTLALLALVVALARPQLSLQEEKITGEGIDIAIAMDVSSSMLAQDFRPNRLEVSKNTAIEFVRKRPNDRIAVVAFSGEAFTPCPLTTDHEVVRTFIGALACGIMEDGTAIGQGLATAVNRLKDSEAVSKVIILLTDGVNNAGYVAPEMAADIALEFGIRVYTIAVGSEGQALTPVSKDRFGKYVYDIATVEIDEDLLKQIAQKTKGRFFRATSPEELAEIYGIIDDMEKTEIESTVVKRYQEKYRVFALFAAICLLLELVLRYTVLRSIP